jgi:hypothetical protein
MASRLLWAMLFAVACSSSGGGGGTQAGAFGACCESASQCASGVCSQDHGACSATCSADSDCPPEPKSGDSKCSNGICEAESEPNCEKGSGGGSGAGASGGSSGSLGSGGSSGSATGGSSGSGGNSASGGSSGTDGSGGSAGSGGTGGSTGSLGLGEPCFDDPECKSGRCYRGGGARGFCFKECSEADSFCLGDYGSGSNSLNEYNYCVPFGNGWGCYPGCVSSASSCSAYTGLTCSGEIQDPLGYNVKVCSEL